MSYTYEIRSQSGTFRISSDNDLQLHRVVEDDNSPATTEEEVEADGNLVGYKKTVMECHKILDGLNIASAKGITCTDPECQSQLGHRLRDLRALYQSQSLLLDGVRNAQTLEEVRKFLDSVGH